MAGMGGDRIQTVSVSAGVTETEPIVLREKPTRRLVFLPTIVDQEPPVRGCFVYQRRAKDSDAWEDIRGERLSSLKAGEGWVLELHADEVAALVDGLRAREDLHKRHGAPRGHREFVDHNRLPAVVRRLLESPEGELAEVLAGLRPQEVVALGRRVDLSQLDALLAAWMENEDRANEGFWQGLLREHAWVFSLLTGSPVVVLSEKAYVGGKGIEGRGGGEVDFLVRNALTDNVSFIEIKTPQTPLLADQYRSSGAHALHRELSGGIVQVLGYRESFANELHALQAQSATREFRAHNPRCVLIAGRSDGLGAEEVRSFELFRGALSDVQIWTFDEVAERLRGMRRVLERTPDEDEQPGNAMA